MAATEIAARLWTNGACASFEEINLNRWLFALIGLGVIIGAMGCDSQKVITPTATTKAPDAKVESAGSKGQNFTLPPAGSK